MATPQYFTPSEPERRATPKIGRNDPCRCGSSRKYKKCCLAKDEAGGANMTPDGGSPTVEIVAPSPAANTHTGDYQGRIASVFGSPDVPDVDRPNLLTYRRYLLANLVPETTLTGREDFPWEERYVLGPGEAREYARLKKMQPSYRDEYYLLEIWEDKMDQHDLIAQVRRLSDSREFAINLSWLTTKPEAGKDSQLLDDYATWVTNW